MSPRGTPELRKKLIGYEEKVFIVTNLKFVTREKSEYFRNKLNLSLEICKNQYHSDLLNESCCYAKKTPETIRNIAFIENNSSDI